MAKATTQMLKKRTIWNPIFKKFRFPMFPVFKWLNFRSHFYLILVGVQIKPVSGCIGFQDPHSTFSEWGKFHPKKVIQIGGLKLSTQIGHIKFFIQKSYQKKYWRVIQKQSYPRIYLTYFTLLYTQKNHPKINNYMTFYITLPMKTLTRPDIPSRYYTSLFFGHPVLALGP